MSYSSVPDHRAMIFDGRRNAAYARAIEQVITPDSIVMDLGAGLGVHGLNAARLGAKEVHLVEPAPVLEVARKIAERNGLENIHYHPVRVEELAADIPVDIIISVFTGNFLLTEDLLPSLFYARDRFLVPDGRLIPGRARMEVWPVAAADFYSEHIAGWESSLEFCRQHGLPPVDYSPVSSYAANSLYYNAPENTAATPLAPPSILRTLDFYSATSADCDEEIRVKVTRAGDCHAWIGWFSMKLCDEWLSTGPDEPGDTHWSPVFLPLETPVTVREGDELTLRLKRPDYGEWSWITGFDGKQQQQSTFLSRPVSPLELQKKSASYRPSLNAKGEAAAFALVQMRGTKNTEDIARAMCVEFPNLFVDEGEARRFVTNLANLYS